MVCVILETTDAGCNTYILLRMKTKKNLLQLTHGVWDPAENTIIIKRSILKSKETFAGVLMHEFAHYVSGYADNTRDFENVLTEMLGFVYSELSIKGEKPKKVGLFKRW